jgi:cytidylate kinase
MSIVAISETGGSLGIEIGRKLAASLGWEFADREILAKASERYGEAVTALRHSVEEKPTLWERFTDTQHRYKAYVEAIMLEMAARDNVVLAGRSSTIVLRQVPYVVRVRTTAPERTRAQRLEHEMGLTHEAALDYVRHSDRERAARVKFLYQIDVDDPLLYDLVLNTEHLTVETGAALIRETLRDERFQSIETGRKEVVDLSLAALARAALMAHPQVGARSLVVTCKDGHVSLRGGVRADEERTLAADVVGRIPGVVGVLNEIVVMHPTRTTVGL